jgi:hypothetical protein
MCPLGGTNRSVIFRMRFRQCKWQKLWGRKMWLATEEQLQTWPFIKVTLDLSKQSKLGNWRRECWGRATGPSSHCSWQSDRPSGPYSQAGQWKCPAVEEIGFLGTEETPTESPGSEGTVGSTKYLVTGVILSWTWKVKTSPKRVSNPIVCSKWNISKK